MSTDTTNTQIVDPSLETVVAELFGGKSTTATLQNGKLVTFRKAKFKEIAAVTKLFQRLLDSIPRDKFMELLAAVAKAQKNAMESERSAEDISMNTIELIDKTFGENSLLLGMFANVLDTLPEFVPMFSDLSAEEFGNLDIDEAVLVASGVVAVNYDFFTRKLLPLVKNVITAWLSKRGGNPSTQG